MDITPNSKKYKCTPQKKVLPSRNSPNKEDTILLSQSALWLSEKGHNARLWSC